MAILKRLWEGWKRLAHRIARFNALVICTVLYYGMIPFIAIPFRLSKDPLRLRGSAGFLPRAPRDRSFEETLRQG